ncbi:hypothetical protein [Streptomyces sp. NPDC050355]|uniref:hypothetical protein n=1 Tax=Streptomyces sp. NPDC050355 TaxID=3365609 RepID=UPI0037A2C694
MTPRPTSQERADAAAVRRTPEERAPRRADLLAAAAGALLVVLAAVIGALIQRANGSLHVNVPPLYASWFWHLGPGTPAALAVAVLVVAYGPPLADRLPWRRLVLTGWAASLAWTWSLALVDGWQTGVARRLTTEYEYLTVIRRFDDLGPALRDFTSHILNTAPDHWPAHVAGHPPAAVLTFVGLDRIGLGGGAWAGAWCITVGTSAAAAVLVALRALTDEPTARRAAPFLALAPAAVWVGTSADGYFAAVAAWSSALLALAATRRTRHPAAAALAAGLLLGLTCYLSYGLTLIAPIAAAVLLLARTARPLPLLAAGVAAVAAVFTLAGFDWWEGYRLLVERYYQGAAAVRPYAYWVWGNLACTVLITGLATAAGLRRVLATAPTAVRQLRARTLPATGRAGVGPLHRPVDRLVILVLAALLALLVADLSGMSKAETERIWLPFAVWLLPACALLPAARHRHWLTAQAVLAMGVNHLLYTGW